MPSITCPACGYANTAAAYYHKCPKNGMYWYTVKLNPQIDITTGMPEPIVCPDGLLTLGGLGGGPGTLHCGAQVRARTLYCYNCKVVTIYPATPAG